jgi:hypothetical protein
MEKVRELTKDEITELLEVWPLIMRGKAPSKKVKHRVIKLYNGISGTKFDKDTSCSSCLGKVFYGLEALYSEYKNN